MATTKKVDGRLYEEVATTKTTSYGSHLLCLVLRSMAIHAWHRLDPPAAETQPARAKKTPCPGFRGGETRSCSSCGDFARSYLLPVHPVLQHIQRVSKAEMVQRKYVRLDTVWPWRVQSLNYYMIQIQWVRVPMASYLQKRAYSLDWSEPGGSPCRRRLRFPPIQCRSRSAGIWKRKNETKIHQFVYPPPS